MMLAGYPSNAAVSPTTNQPETKESLADIAKRLKARLKNSALAETRVAAEVMRIAADWDKYREEAGGKEIGPWLKANVHPSRGFKWYQARAQAALRATRALKGPSSGVLDRLETQALVWLSGSVAKDEDYADCLRRVTRAYQSQRGTPLSRSQVATLCAEYATKGGTRPTAKDIKSDLRAHIKRLQAQVRELGGEPVE